MKTLSVIGSIGEGLAVKCPQCKAAIELRAKDTGEPNSGITFGKTGRIWPSYVVCMNPGCRFADDVVLRS